MLHAADGDAVNCLVAGDPVLNCVLDTRLRVAPDLNPHRLGGFLWGVPTGPDRAESRRLRAAAFHGGNLIPIGEDLAALETIAQHLVRNGRGCSSIVGPADAVSVMWPVLARRWGRRTWARTG